MTTVVDICNLALSEIRAGSINSIDEASVEAQQCKLKYPIVRDIVLKAAQWGFATTIKPLAPLTIDVFDWSFSYQYPSDCLHIDRLIRNQETNLQGGGVYVPQDALVLEEEPVEYKVYTIENTRVIVANEDTLRAEYRLKVTDPVQFPEDVIMAIAQLLAAHIATPIVGGDLGRQMKSDALEMYGQYVASAASASFNEQHVATPDSEFVTIR